MIVDFNKIGFDYYGNPEPPILSLKTMDGTPLGHIGVHTNLNPVFRFVDVSEITFNVPCFDEDGVKYEMYDEILAYRIVNYGGIGDFVLIDVSENNDGIKQYKTCKAYSYEYVLNFKKIYIPEGTYCFYTPYSDNTTIMSIILELLPEWSIGHIDEKLISNYKTFENIDNNLYNFMRENLQQTYNCIFDFDIENKIINVYDANNDIEVVPIFLSYDNLVSEIDVKDLSEELITVVSGYGGDDITIANANPNGTDKIYNLDYFIERGDISEVLAKRWNAYKDTISTYRPYFNNMMVEYMRARAQLTKATNDLANYEELLKKKSDALIGTDVNIDKYEEFQKEIYELMSETIPRAKTNEKRLELEYDSILKALQSVQNICAINSFFSEQELLQLSRFFKEDTISEENYTLLNYSDATTTENSKEFTSTDKALLEIIGGKDVIKLKNYAELTEEELADTSLDQDTINTIYDAYNESLKKYIYNITGGCMKLTALEDFGMSGDIESAYLQINKDNLVEDETNENFLINHFLVTAVLRNVEFEGNTYPTANLTFDGMISNNTYTELDGCSWDVTNFDNLKLYIRKGSFYLTPEVTDYQKQSVYQELYDFVEDSLKKIAEPSYEFSVTSGNFIFDKLYGEYRKHLRLGKGINLVLDDGVTINPLLIEISFSYDDIATLTLTISSKFKSSQSASLLADILNDSVNTSKSLSLNKYTYSSYKESGDASRVSDFKKHAFDVAKKNIINSNNQGQEWTENGLFLRKTKEGVYDPEQVAMVNNTIVFTDDNWNTVRTALGKVSGLNGEDLWGIVGENIMGKLIAGENLLITNTNEIGEMSFQVDATGAWINNGSLVFSGVNKNNNVQRMFIDPRWGLAMGNSRLFTNEDGTTLIKPGFIGEDGKIIMENIDGKLEMPANSNFYMDINTGDVYMRGTIYAKDGYFAGTIDASNIIAGTLKVNGKDIVDGAITADKIESSADLSKHVYSLSADTITSGTIGADYIKSSVITAINANVGTAIIDSARIGDISADKIVGGTIDASKISVNNIDASSIKTGTLDASKVTIANLSADNIEAFTVSADQIVGGTISAELLKGENGILENGFIKDAYIPSLSAGKISSGSLNTNNITIQSDDGGLNIANSLIQWKDGNGTIRMQAGKDASNNFTFAVFGEDGTTCYFDQGGIKEQAIPDGVIVNDMISSSTKIDADKLNLNTLGYVKQENGNYVLNASHVYSDGESFSVKLSQMSNRTDTLENRLDNSFTLYVTSNFGSVITSTSHNMELYAVLYRAGEDITNEYDNSYFIWTRRSNNTLADIDWNNRHSTGTKTLSLTREDVVDGADFICSFTTPDGEVIDNE